MTKKSPCYFALSLMITFVSCNNQLSSPTNYMVLDEITYVSNFPQSFTLENKANWDIDIIGVSDFVIYDSLMIISTRDQDGLWTFMSLPDYRIFGNFLSKGNGPSEFIMPPSIDREMRLVKEQNQLMGYIYDFQKGKIYKMNIDESIKNKKIDMSVLYASFPPFLFNWISIDSMTFFCKEVNQNQTQQIRYILENNERKELPLLEKLNQATIKEGEDINIVSTMAKMNFDKNYVVEMPIGLNYINMYALDGSFAKTICIGDKIDRIDEIQDIERWDRIYTYAELRIFPDFFGIVRINEDEKTYQTGRKRLPFILLFDWQGEPLAELKLDHFITSFDIDFINGDLYTLDVHSDELFKYDVRDLLSKLKK